MTESVAASPACHAHHRPLRGLTIALVAVLALAALMATSASAAVAEVNLAQYKRVHRYALPLPPGTPAPVNSLLAEEASGVTYDPVTETLFIVGDGGTSVVQVDKEGHLVNSMTLAPEASRPSGETFYDTEGIAYVGNEEFVITEERESKLDRFKYVAGGELHRADVKTVKIGNDNANIGLEGVTNDPLNPGQMIAVKESGPERIYSTAIDWTAQTATNFEAEGTGPGEGELFPAADAKTLDFSDVYALANVPGISAAEESNLLIISQESGEVVNIGRDGIVHSRLAELADPSDTISVPDMTNEGVTMDQNGTLYIVGEDGGGDQAHPQLWVYEPQSTPDTPPTAVTLGNQVTSLPESTTGARVKLATVTVTDPDGFGENDLSVTGPDASYFEVDHNGLYLKAGTVLNAATKAEYEVSVQVDDPAGGAGPDATSAPYKLTVASNGGGTSAAQIAITEVAPWSSGESPFESDWFELTNVGTTKVDMTGWRINDNHASFASSVPWEGVTSLAPGHSAVLVNGAEAKATEFIADWFPGGAPAGFQIGWIPDGPGLGTSGDEVNIYDSTGAKVSGVAFGASPSAAPFGTFDNSAALGIGATNDPTISTLSAAGANEAFSTDAGKEVGSPGSAPVKTPVAVTEVAPWGSSWAEYKADWFELTNESPVTVSLTGWKMDDSSDEAAKAVALTGVAALAPGESAVFVELDTSESTGEKASKVAAFKASWFGSAFPAGLQVGTYEGSGVGLGTGGDGVNIFNSEGAHLTGVSFGANEGTKTGTVLTAAETFDNHAGVGAFIGAPPTIAAKSVEGQFGARDAHDQIGSPGRTTTAPAELTATAPVFPSQAAGTVGPGQWVTITNAGGTVAAIAAVRIEESNPESAGDFILGADHCTGATIVGGESCQVLVRFAPGRENATSSAELVIASDAPGSPLTVTLSGTSTGLPQGEKGDTGETGPKGDPGATGSQGPKGDAGPKGDTGARGPAGPTGPTGPQGPAGKNGKNGKDGVVEFLASGSSVQARRGGVAHLTFQIRNRTAGALRGAKVIVDSLATKGTDSAAVAPIKAGKSDSVTLDLRIGRDASLGHHRVRVELRAGGHAVTQTVVVRVTR